MIYSGWQILPVSPVTSTVRGNQGDAQYELVFMATAPPLGYNTYFIRPATDQQCTISAVTHPTTDTVISNDVSGSVTIATFNCAIVVVLQINSGWWEWPC